MIMMVVMIMDGIEVLKKNVAPAVTTLPAAPFEGRDKTLSDFVRTSGGMVGVGAGAAAATAANLEAAAAEDNVVEGNDGIPPALDNGCISAARASADKIAFRWG